MNLSRLGSFLGCGCTKPSNVEEPEPVAQKPFTITSAINSAHDSITFAPVIRCMVVELTEAAADEGEYGPVREIGELFKGGV